MKCFHCSYDPLKFTSLTDSFWSCKACSSAMTTSLLWFYADYGEGRHSQGKHATPPQRQKEHRRLHFVCRWESTFGTVSKVTICT